MLKKLLLTLAVMSGMIAGVAIASPAFASERCPVGQFCIFSGPSETGTMWTYSWSASGGVGVCNILGSSANQDVSVLVGWGTRDGNRFYHNSSCDANLLYSTSFAAFINFSPGDGVYHNITAFKIYHVS